MKLSSNILFVTSFIIMTSKLFMTSQGYNLDVDDPFVSKGPEGSYFGLSVALHTLNVDKSSDYGTESPPVPSMNPADNNILVGAPMDQTPRYNFPTGSMYKCDVSMENCERMDQIETSDPSNQPTGGQWLGVAIKSQGKGMKVAVCAHRWSGYSNSSGSKYWESLFGKCYVLDNELNVEDISPLIPCSQTQEGVALKIEFHKYCQAGTSVAWGHPTDKNPLMLMGMPGSYFWQGAMFAKDMGQSFFGTDGESYVSREFYNKERKTYDVITRNSYLGFSVTSGVMLEGFYVSVAGAPRANGTGFAVVFNSTMSAYGSLKTEMHQILIGELVASAFGYAVELVDLNNDGLDDLIVGAPQYYDRENNQGGAVYVYMNDGSGYFSNKYTQKLTGQIDSEFGGSLIPCGDLDGDGFVEIAIGAPQADGGKGIVEIYSASLSGLLDEPTQTLRIPNVRGFGYSLGGDQDVDGNGYPDLVVGSLSDKAVLFRSRPVVKVNSVITSTKNVLSFPGSEPFELKVCMNYTSIEKYNQPIKVNYTLLLDSVNYVNERRVVFVDHPSQDKHMAVIDISGQGVNKCDTVKLRVKNQIVDKLSPVNVKLTYDIKETPKRRKKRDVQPLLSNPVIQRGGASE